MSQPIRASFALPGHIEDNSQLLNLGPSEQVYGHSAGVCRALPLGVVRREWPHPWHTPTTRRSTTGPPKGVYSQSRSRRCTDLKGRHMGDRQGPLLRIPALAALMRPCMSRRECRFCIVTGMSLIKAMQEQLPRSKNLPPVRLDSRIGCRSERPYTYSEGSLYLHKVFCNRITLDFL